jgi:hypothetical protein
VAFKYSDLLVDVWANNCPNPSKPQCPAPSKPQCPNPSQNTATCPAVATTLGGLTLLQEQLRASV